MKRIHTCLWSFYLIRWTYLNLTALRDWHCLAFILHRGMMRGQIAKGLGRKWTRSSISIHVFQLHTQESGLKKLGLDESNYVMSPV